MRGDGNSQELETAVRLGLNFVVLILQDNTYGMIRWKQSSADGFLPPSRQGSDVFALPAGRHGRTKDGPPLCPQEGAHDSSSRNFLRMRLNATGFSIIEK
jgi:hypothetical protein